MKLFVRNFLIVAALAAPALSQAQQSGQPAQAQQNDATSSSYGGAASGKEQAGSQQKLGGLFHRQGNSTANNNCTGPVSYCNIFFGS